MHWVVVLVLGLVFCYFFILVLSSLKKKKKIKVDSQSSACESIVKEILIACMLSLMQDSPEVNCKQLEMCFSNSRSIPFYTSTLDSDISENTDFLQVN